MSEFLSNIPALGEFKDLMEGNEFYSLEVPGDVDRAKRHIKALLQRRIWTVLSLGVLATSPLGVALAAVGLAGGAGIPNDIDRWLAEQSHENIISLAKTLRMTAFDLLRQQFDQ